MPLISAAIGLRTAAMQHDVDARWAMAYSASLGEMAPIYMDTRRSGGLLTHPLFAICPEWPVVLASRDLLLQRGLTEAEFRRNVHATHDCHVYRLIRPGDRLSTRATIVALEARKPGAYVTTCLDSHDQHGELVARTFNGMLFRDVEIMAVDKAPVADLDPAIEIPPTPHENGLQCTRLDYEMTIPIAANLAHTYTECARIYNPVHTDVAVATGAGLPDIILHGSAFLALAVSAVCGRYADADPRRVIRISGQFRGMVRLPSCLVLRCFEPQVGAAASVVPFELVHEDGARVMSHGSIVLAATQTA